MPKEQRKLFEDNGWEIVDSAQPAHNEPPPLCYSSTWLSMNVLVLDPKTVCVEKSEIYQAEQLNKLGMEVIPVELRDAYAFGGGSLCAGCALSTISQPLSSNNFLCSLGSLLCGLLIIKPSLIGVKVASM